MLRRVALTIWCVISLGIASRASLLMMVTFATGTDVQNVAPECREVADHAESTGIERARNAWIRPVFLASSLLAINSLALTVVAWRRQALPV